MYICICMNMWLTVALNGVACNFNCNQRFVQLFTRESLHATTTHNNSSNNNNNNSKIQFTFVQRTFMTNYFNVLIIKRFRVSWKFSWELLKLLPMFLKLTNRQVNRSNNFCSLGLKYVRHVINMTLIGFWFPSFSFSYPCSSHCCRLALSKFIALAYL